VEEEYHGYQGGTSYWDIEVETPSPSDQIGEDTPKKRTCCCTYSKPEQYSLRPLLSLREEISNETHIKPTTAVSTGLRFNGTA
jgi:hypothetical protein